MQREAPEGRRLAFAGGDISPDGAGWIERPSPPGRRAAAHLVAQLAR
jgi:hypothetical protein